MSYINQRHIVPIVCPVITLNSEAIWKQGVSWPDYQYISLAQDTKYLIEH